MLIVLFNSTMVKYLGNILLPKFNLKNINNKSVNKNIILQ